MISRSKAAIFALIATSVIAGCNRQNPESTSQPPNRTRPLPRPEPAALPVPGNIGDLLPEWFAEWRTIGVTLEPESFATQTIKRLPAEKYEIDLGLDVMVQRKPFFIPSPESTRAVDPYIGIDLTVKEGRTVVAGRDDGVSVAVMDLNRQTGFQTLQCGTPCIYHDAAWADENTFIVVGTYSLMPGDAPNSGTSTVIAPALMVVSLTDSILTTFTGPLVDEEIYARSGIAGYLGRKLARLFPD